MAAIEGRFCEDVNIRNGHPERDSRVTFVHDEHATYLDGDMTRRMAGVTSTIGHCFFLEFDAEKVSNQLADREAAPKPSMYQSKYAGQTDGRQIRAKWRANCERGTIQHGWKECILRGIPLTEEQRLEVVPGFVKFILDNPGLVPKHVERRIFSVKAWLAGAYDAECEGGILIDWKHCKYRGLCATPAMERYMIDCGILAGPVHYSNADERLKEEEDAAALVLKHKERKELLKKLKKEKKDKKGNRTVDAMWRESKREAGLVVVEAEEEADGDAAGEDDNNEAALSKAFNLPPLERVPWWWKSAVYKPQKFGPHPLTEQWPDESLAHYAIQMNLYQGLREEECLEEGWPPPGIKERWIVNTPPERPKEYELYRIRRIDHRPFFARLPWDETSPLNLAIDPDRELCIAPIPHPMRESLRDEGGPTRVGRICPGPVLRGCTWVGSAYNKGAYKADPLPPSQWAIPAHIKCWDKNPLMDSRGRIKEVDITDEEMTKYRKWVRGLAIQARRYESYLLRSRGLVCQLVPQLAGRMLLCWCRTDVEEKYCHAQILALYTNALLAGRSVIREPHEGTLDHYFSPRPTTTPKEEGGGGGVV